MTTTSPQRPTRTYTVTLRDGGETETRTVTVPEGTKKDQVASAHAAAVAEAEDWVGDGEWGDEGASVHVSYVLADDETEWEAVWTTVAVPPNHHTLITAVMGDEGCGSDPRDHTWTGRGHGGCRENPGVWGAGGTAITISDHCSCCGLRRERLLRGSQRNPGESDTVSYSAPAEGGAA